MTAKTRRLPRVLYLIRRGPRSEHHKAPFHPVIVCANRGVAQWEAGATDDIADVWVKQPDSATGLLMVRWRGLDIDYGHVVRSMPMPDGSKVAISHDRESEPWTLFDGAVWWSSKCRPPDWLEGRVIEAPDEFTRRRIVEDEEHKNHGIHPTRPW